MAVGATQQDVRVQFLVEALSAGVSKLLQWPAIIAPAGIVVAVVFSVAIGIFFGYYPVLKALNSIPSKPCGSNKSKRGGVSLDLNRGYAASLTSGSTSVLPTTLHWTEAFAIGRFPLPTSSYPSSPVNLPLCRGDNGVGN